MVVYQARIYFHYFSPMVFLVILRLMLYFPVQLFFFLFLSLLCLCSVISGTLYKHLDHCITSSGKRLLRRWICHPLKDINEINDRLNVVEGLIKQQGVMSVMREYLCKLPDLERLLGRVKAAVGSSSTLFLPSIGEKILKQRVMEGLFTLIVLRFPHLLGLLV